MEISPILTISNGNQIWAQKTGENFGLKKKKFWVKMAQKCASKIRVKIGPKMTNDEKKYASKIRVKIGPKNDK